MGRSFIMNLISLGVMILSFWTLEMLVVLSRDFWRGRNSRIELMRGGGVEVCRGMS